MARLMKRPEIIALFDRFEKADPTPKTELQAGNDFCLLVSIVLSAQATDAGVNKATPALFTVADTAEKMVALGEERLDEFVKTINFHRTKAKNVIALSRMIVKQFDGKIPEEEALLVTLPGVGSKTAKVWLNCARAHPLIAVDTHVFRVSNRLGLCETKTAEKTEVALAKTVPEDKRAHAHHWLILHGRYVCKARLPECWRCLMRDLCRYPDKVLEPPKPRKSKF